MNYKSILIFTIILLTGCLAVTGIVAASGEIQAYMGETIPLQGYSSGSQTVYLFLTGPNLPSNGVALNNIYQRADQGHFTEVDVDSNNHWEYKWGTNSLGGSLDAGTYTVWVVNGPNDRSHLSEADYSTISVQFGKPAISVDTPIAPGKIVLYSLPNETSVTLDTNYKGKTPLSIEGLAPGTYTVTFSQFGYEKFSTPVKVESGSASEVTATLKPHTGSLVVNTSPSGARIMIDGADAGISPATIVNLMAGNHTLNVSAEGYTPSEQMVTVLGDLTVPVNVSLAQPGLFSGTRAAGMVPATLIAGVCAIVLIAVNRHRKMN